MKIDNNGRVLYFSEKPKGEDLKAMVKFSIIVIRSSHVYMRNIITVLVEYMLYQQVDTTVLGLDAEAAKKSPYIASMGVYVFKKDILLKLLR